MLEHPVLMNAGLVGEGIGTDHRLVRLHRIAGNLRNQLRRWHDLRRVDACFELEDIRTRPDSHDDFFERRIAGPLAEAVDSALDLTSPRQHRRQ